MFLVQKRLQTESYRRHENSLKTSVTSSRNVFPVDMAQRQLHWSVGVPSALEGLVRRPLAFIPRARRQAFGQGGKHIINFSGVHSEVPGARGVGSSWGPSPQEAQRCITPSRAVGRRADPWMAVTPPKREGGDDEFDVAFARLASSAELQDLRESVLELDRLLANAIDDQDFAAAARLRDEVGDLRSKDPEGLVASTRAQLRAAVEEERYEEATKYRDRLRTLRVFMPEYALAGAWKVREVLYTAPGLLGEWSRQGSLVRMCMVGTKSDTLIAVGLNGEVIFIAEVSQPLSASDGPALSDSDGPGVEFRDYGQVKEVTRFFHGEGFFAGGGGAPGQMYLLADKILGFWWSGGGGGRVGAGDGLGGRRGGAEGAERLLAAGGTAGGSGGGGSRGAFVVFEKIGELDKDIEELAAELNKLLGQDLQ